MRKPPRNPFAEARRPRRQEHRTAEARLLREFDNPIPDADRRMADPPDPEELEEMEESERDRLFQLIRRLLERKVGIEYISHRLEEVPLIGTRVTVLRDGKLVGTLPVNEVSEDKLIEMMVGRQLEEQFTKNPAVRGEEVFRVENLSVPGKLYDLSFNLHRGEILGVFGSMGAGQNTLTRALFGLQSETRIAILRAKSANEGVDLPQDVVECIAANVTSNIRELEGCLIGLLAKASLEGREITIDLAREVVKVVAGDVRSPLTIEAIQRTVCDYFSIPEDLIRAKTRKQEIVNARQIAMYLAKELTNCSLKTIGLHFGGRDHSTVIHAYQSVEDQMQVDPKYQANVQQVRKRLRLLSHA